MRIDHRHTKFLGIFSVISLLTLSIVAIITSQLLSQSSVVPEKVSAQKTPEQVVGHQEILVKFKQQSPSINLSQNATSKGINLNKEQVSWVDIDTQNSSPSLSKLNEKFLIDKVDKVFKNETLEQLSNIYKIRVGNVNTENLNSAIEILTKDPSVEYAQPNFQVSIAAVPNDTYFSSSNSWGQVYDDLWGLKKINPPDDWWNQGVEIVKVAVVDTGVDSQHVDLSQNIWTNSREILDDNIDNDNNGYIDDIHGWNFSSNTNNSSDDNGHGTHVAGTIAAVANNNIGIVGVAPKSQIIPVKVLNSSGSGYIDSIAKGIIYAARNGAKVINNSWGCIDYCPKNPVAEDAVRQAINLGVTVVFSAGNDGGIDVVSRSPQNMTNPKPIVVAASTHLNSRATFSDKGALVDVTAPGGGISSPPPAEHLGPISNILSLKSSVSNRPDYLAVGDKYLRLAGTSMAAPHVSGLAAYLIAQNPTLSPDAVRQYIRSSATDIQPQGWDSDNGSGLINMSGAKSLLTNPLPLPQISSPVSGFEIHTDSHDIIGVANGSNFQSYTLRYQYTTTAPPSNWVTIKTGTSPITNGSLGVWNTKDLNDGKYTLQLLVVDKSNRTTSYEVPIWITKELLPGFPVNSGFVADAVTVANLDVSGGSEIIVNSVKNGLQVLDSQGKMMSGWPINIAANGVSFTTPAAGDLDGDGDLEIVVTSSLGIYAFHHNGSLVAGFPRLQGGQFTSSPIIADVLKGSGYSPEIVVGSVDSIFVLSNTGTIIRQKNIAGAGTHRGIAVADIIAGGDLEIVVAVDGTIGDNPDFLHVLKSDLSSLSGWPVTLHYGVSGDTMLPVIADIDKDGGLDILIGTVGSPSLFAFNSLGKSLPGWPKSGGVSKKVYIIPSNLDGDSQLELIAAGFYKVHQNSVAFNHDGTAVLGWPNSLTANYLLFPPTVANVDVDSDQEVIVTDTNAVFAYNPDGSLVTGWLKVFPLDYEGSSSAQVVNLDGDNFIDIVTTYNDHDTEGGIVAWELGAEFTSKEKDIWPVFLQENQHASAYIPKSIYGSCTGSSISTCNFVQCPGGCDACRIPSCINSQCGYLNAANGTACFVPVSLLPGTCQNGSCVKNTTPTISQPNLLPNSGFDSADPKTSSGGSYGTATNTTAQFQWVSDKYRSTGRSVKIIASGPTTSLSRWYSKTDSITASPGSTYTASAWLHTGSSTLLGSGANVTINFWKKDTSGNLVHLGGKSSASKTSTANSWSQVSVSPFTAPAGTQYVRVEMRLVGAGTLWWDDIQLVKQ